MAKLKIDVNDLHKHYGKNEVLKGINEHIEKGEVVVVIGPSGSGKSTFLRCLNLLEVPTSGEIIFLNDMGILEAGKYYIGEKDGYIAIFKAGEDGRPFIEKPEDVSTKKIEDLPEVDRSKISNFEKKYDTREECEENITNYIS